MELTQQVGNDFGNRVVDACCRVWDGKEIPGATDDPPAGGPVVVDGDRSAFVFGLVEVTGETVRLSGERRCRSRVTV